MKKSQLISNLSIFKEALRDNREWISLCQVMEEEMAMDGSAYQVKVETIPLGKEALVNVTRDPAISSPARPGDLWIVCFLSGNYNNGFLIKQVTSMEEKIHPKSVDGETVVSSRENKKINISNDPKAKLDEPLLLGKTTSEWLVKLVKEVKKINDKVETLNSKYKTHIHTSSSLTPQLPIPAAEDPQLAADPLTDRNLTNLESDPEQEKLKSDLAFVQERGLQNSP